MLRDFAGAPIIYANEHFCELSGYEREEVLGRNCRFMQGPQTEQDAVRRVVESVRCARQGQVELTNYKADGTAFRNLLSLQPVHDSNGVYRYSIGVLSDAATLDEGGREEVERLRRLLPSDFHEDLAAKDLPPRFEDTDTASTVHDQPGLDKLFGVRNASRTFRMLLNDGEGLEALKAYLGQGVGESGLKQLELLLAVRELSAQPADAQAAQARELADAFMPGFEGASPAELVDQLLQAAGETAEAFASAIRK